MPSSESLHKLGVLAGALMIGAGLLVGVRAFSRLPVFGGSLTEGTARERTAEVTPIASPIASGRSSGESAASTKPTATPAPLFQIGATAQLPDILARALAESGSQVVPVASAEGNAGVDLVYAYDEENANLEEPIFRQVYTVVGPFESPSTTITMDQVKDAWLGENRRYPTLAVLNQDLAGLETLFGPVQRSTPITFDSTQDVRDALYDGVADLAILPFDQLMPELTVFEVNGINPLWTDGQFDMSSYPLIAMLYALPSPTTPNQEALSDFVASLPTSNRDASKLTTVAMTGVTAMVRFTAARMDQRGNAWPAEDVGPTLAAADITAISNEIPFVDGCETDLDPDNIVFCSKPEYMEALLAAGADIIGLTGNHQNDHGPDAALRSLQYYEDAGLKVYGGGADKASAMQPLVVEHNGNKIAFLGANSYGPPEAWATDFLPGSAPFDLNIMSAMIRSLKEDGDADVVMAELQYQESYDVVPLPDQMQDFRALVRAGADVVTGVQSHVVQAVEFLDGKPILYGLGNLFFDQMWEEDTREGMVAMHTIYDGRLISTRLLPTILYDYGQPRFASPIDGARILQRVFDALP